MKLVGFRSFDWEGSGYSGGIPTDAKPYLPIDPQVLNRVGNTPTFGPSIIGERRIPCEFAYTGGVLSYEEAWNQLLVRLGIYDTRPGQLRARRLDGTLVACDAILTMPNTGSFFGIQDITSLPCMFVSVDPFWRALSPISASKVFSNPLDMAFAVPISTAISDEPIITLQPTVNRTNGNSLAGFKYRRTERVTNNTGVPLVNHPYALSLGSTTALVSGSKALASGNDVRVFRDGIEVPRTLQTWNSAASFIWVTIPNLAAGSSIDFDIVYGNPSAGAPPTPTGVARLAIDPATSTNAVLKYPINPVAGNAGLGGWNLSSGTEVPVADTSSPLAWRWVTTLQSADDFLQDRYDTYSASGLKYRAIFAADRARAAGLPARNEGTRADGVMLYCPATISQVRVDLQWLNDYEIGASGNPVGRVVILSSPNGETWNVVQGWNTAQTTLASIAVANYAIPNTRYIAFAVWPRVGEVIPTTATAGKRVYAQWDTTLEVTQNAALMPQTSVQAEESIYEYALELRIGGDTALNAPYKALRIGGAGDRRLVTRLNERLAIDLGARTAAIHDSTGATKIKDASVLAIQSVEKIAGSSAEQVSGLWLDMQPYVNPLPNPSFLVSLTGWSRRAVSGSVTAAVPNRDTVTYKTAPASLRSQLTASTLGANQVALIEYADAEQPIAGRPRITVAADQRTDNANLQPALIIEFLDISKSLISTSRAADWSPVAGNWYRTVHSAPVPANAVYYRVGHAVYTKSANQIGSIWLDDIQPCGLDLIVTDLTGDLGTMTVTVSWLAQYL